jgi:hypothetical protein
MTELSPDEITVIESFLGGFWYDRPDEDAVIVEDVFDQFDVDSVADRVALLQRLLASSLSLEQKAGVVRRSAWRYFEDDAAAVVWVAEITESLQREVTRRSR